MTYQLSASSHDAIARSRINERIVPNILLIWLDNNIDKNSINYHNTITQFRRVVNTIETFTDRDQCIDFLTDIRNKNVILIISEALCQSVVPLIHDVTRLHTIFIFCKNEARCKRWAERWPKIKGVFTQVTSICQRLKKLARKSEQNAISISVTDTSSDVANKKLDQLDSSFMYTQILKEILLTINFEQIHFQKFVQYCRDLNEGNPSKRKDIENFEQKYHDETPIWWYTRECFLYPMLNSALRLMDVEIILKMGFYIRDLHHDIERLHSEQFSERCFRNSFTVYRGQKLSKADFDQMEKTKGGLLSFNSFLSTSKAKNVSSTFAYPDPSDSEFVGVLFVINVDPSKSTTPFASISNISHIKDEDEVLFSMHSVFRIEDIKPESDYSGLYQINLVLTCDNDEELRVLTDRIREETFPNSIGWDRLGQVLFIMGYSDKAQQVYDMLLEQSRNKSENASIYHQLGLAKYDQGEYREAIEYYEKSLAIKQKRLPPNHPYLAISYNNIGNVYGTIGDHSKALWFHEKALEIQEQFFPPNHPDLAKYYNNIGVVYGLMSKYLEALSFHEKALEIRQRSLPPNHPDLASSYNNVGGVYVDMEEYSKALSSFEKALEIRKRSLPPDHPDLAKYYNNIGVVYGLMSKYLEALSFHEKALEIRQRSLPPNHPDLASSYNNVGGVYVDMEEYSKALSSFEKALEIRKRSLPPDHPDLAKYYNNIGNVYGKMHEFGKALSLFEKALQIQEKSLPSTHPELAKSYSNIGLVHEITAKYSEARKYYERAVNAAKDSLPSNHPNMTLFKKNLDRVNRKL